MEPIDLTEVLKDAPPGAWVALSNDRRKIAGMGSSMREALDKAAENGEADPILLRMPGRWKNR